MSLLMIHIQRHQSAASGLEGLLTILHDPDTHLSPVNREHLLYAALGLATLMSDGLDSVNLPEGCAS